MGDIADMYRDMEFDYRMCEEDEDNREEDYVSRRVWPAKTGEIHVTEMDNEHLSNALNYIKKNKLNSLLQFMIEDEIDRRKLNKLTRIPHIEFAWAIRQKSTRYFLPARKNGRGFSFDEPTKDCFPRLFKSELSASRALSAWLRGHWKVEWHQRGGFGWDDPPEDVQALEQEKVEGRDPHDMEIVQFILYEVTQK